MSQPQLSTRNAANRQASSFEGQPPPRDGKHCRHPRLDRSTEASLNSPDAGEFHHRASSIVIPATPREQAEAPAWGRALQRRCRAARTLARGLSVRPRSRLRVRMHKTYLQPLPYAPSRRGTGNDHSRATASRRIGTGMYDMYRSLNYRLVTVRIDVPLPSRSTPR